MLGFFDGSGITFGSGLCATIGLPSAPTIPPVTGGVCTESPIKSLPDSLLSALSQSLSLLSVSKSSP